MTVNLQRLRILVSQQAEIGIFFQRLSQIDEIAVGLRHERGVGQSRADRLGNVKRGRPLGNFFHASIRKLHMNAVCHKVELCGCTESFSLLEGVERVKHERISIVLSLTSYDVSMQVIP